MLSGVLAIALVDLWFVMLLYCINSLFAFLSFVVITLGLLILGYFGCVGGLLIGCLGFRGFCNYFGF